MWKLGVGVIMVVMLASLIATGCISASDHDPMGMAGVIAQGLNGTTTM